MAKRATTSSNRVFDTLRDLILRGELAAGSRLGEVELADRLGVSRTPIREAFGRLAAEGLIELVPNRGARVTSFTRAELQGVFDVRVSVEPELTALAVTHATDADIDRLQALAERMVEVGTPGPNQDLDALVPLNRQFHDDLAALAQHPALRSVLAGVVRAPIVLRNFHAYDDASLRRSLAHHVEIVAALRARDPQWAKAVMTAHIRNARAVLIGAADEEGTEQAASGQD